MIPSATAISGGIKSAILALGVAKEYADKDIRDDITKELKQVLDFSRDIDKIRRDISSVPGYSTNMDNLNEAFITRYGTITAKEPALQLIIDPTFLCTIKPQAHQTAWLHVR